jgi:hypothetical protein
MGKLFDIYPGTDELLAWHKSRPGNPPREVNAHLHTPYSFSAFQDIDQLFDLAGKEHLEVLGINDFFTTDGYHAFYEQARRSGIFPLFNIEFIGLMKEEQKRNIRVNDPENPGRTYLCGKALDYPFTIPGAYAFQLETVRKESQRQIRQMVGRMNEYCRSVGVPLQLTYDDILTNFAKKMVRERHIARAVRVGLAGLAKDNSQMMAWLRMLYQGREVEADLEKPAAVENEIRSRLLKAGGPAFVEEDPDAFLDVQQLIEIIHAAGGVPCYPVLLDNRHGAFTEFEASWTSLKKRLGELKIGSVELIPGRNDIKVLKEFVMFFHENGFIVTFGTEHNTPEMIPLAITSRTGIPIDEPLKQVGYEGACVLAAHQYLRAKGIQGYTGTDGEPRIAEKNDFVQLGKAVFDWYFTNA